MVNLIDENFRLHAARVPDACEHMQTLQQGDITYVDSGLSCDTFNIVHIRHQASVRTEDLACVLSYFDEKNFARCLWLNQETLTPQLANCFSDLELVRQNEEVGMALDLVTFTPSTHELHHNIVTVKDRKTIEDFARVLAANWQPPDVNVMAYYRQAADQYLDKQHGIILLCYYHEGVPVSTIELFPTDTQTIGLYGLATLSSHRGKGIGYAMMSKALNLARALGYSTAVLQASADGLGIYKKLGFKEYSVYYEYA